MFKRQGPSFDKVDTIIGKGTEFKGTISSAGVVRIDGRVEGEILHRGDLIVGETGTVVANIKARHVTVAGEVRGNVEAEGKLEIVPTGRLFGDVKVAGLVIADGAVFRGASEMRAPERPPAPPGAPRRAEAD